jgi:hypothetical protein
MFSGKDHTVNDNSSGEDADQRLSERRAKYVLNFNGQPWFFRLKASRSGYDTGLFGYYGEKNLRTGVVIARDMRGHKGEYKMFTWFPDHDDFVSWATDAEQPWHYYEVIGATKSQQKPYFDLDISVEFLTKFRFPDCTCTGEGCSQIGCGKEYAVAYNDVDDSTGQGVWSLNLKATRFANYVACVIKRSLRSTFRVISTVSELDYTIYQSKYENSDRQARKFSFHIVFSTVYFDGHVDMRRFGCQFKADHPEISEVIDDIWYSTRQFRTMQSWKISQSPETAKKALPGIGDWDASFVTRSPPNIFLVLLEYPQ